MNPTVAIGYRTQYEYPNKPQDLQRLVDDEQAKIAAEMRNQTSLEDHLAAIQSPGAVIGGMVLISQSSFASVTTATVSNVFSSQYSNYRIIIYDFVSQYVGNSLLTMQLGTANTNYNYAYYGFTYAGATASLSIAAGTFWAIGATTNAFFSMSTMDINDPFRSTASTSMTCQYQTPISALSGGGLHTTAASYSSFTLSNFVLGQPPQTFSCKVAVYGYRNL